VVAPPRGCPCRIGGDYFDKRKKEPKVSYLIRRLEKLTGGAVSIEIQPAVA